MKKMIHFLPIALLLMMASCDVHEFPEEEPNMPPQMNCEFRLIFDSGAMDMLTTVEYATADRPSRAASRAEASHDFRYYINIFSEDPDTRVPTRTPTGTMLLTVPATVPGANGETQDHDLTVNLDLKPGSHRIIVWADHVAEGSTADLYYSTDDFASIQILTPDDAHPGNIPWRDAFRGQVSVSVNADMEVMIESEDTPVSHVDIPMHRPMARYRIITTDLNEFISRAQAPASDPNSLPQLAPAISPDPDDYRVIIRYNGYMPSVYNAHTDRPVNSKLGVWYDGEISRLDANSAQLASDYVLVNGQQTSVQLVLEVLDKRTGKSIASTEPFTVPLSRNKLTLVKGPFLTSKATGGMGILPDFSGEFNYEVR